VAITKGQESYNWVPSCFEQYWMDEKDLWSIWLLKLCTDIEKAIRKQNCLTCKGPTSLGQSQQIRKLQMGGGLEWILTNEAILDG
jgi:hypothetical protein